jgi:sulfur carrier protein ThiS
MNVIIDRPKKELQIDFTGTAEQLMDEVDVNPETVIVAKDGEVVTPDTDVSDADEVKFVSVVSGG